MTSDCATAAPADSLWTAVTKMQENRFSCVLVVEYNRPVGIITERDIVKMFSDAIAANAIIDYCLRDVMTTELVCINQTVSLYDGLNLARSKKLRHLPVVDDSGQLVGVVTPADMLGSYPQLFKKQDELESANQQLQLLSNEDALLSIGNRRAMEAGLMFAEASAKRTNSCYAIALLDVDCFKKYNDHYGHQAGDNALQGITKAIKCSLRDSDQLYRYGGEEFLLLMPDTDIDEAVVGTERIRLAVEQMNEPHIDSPYTRLTVSIGVAAQQAGEWEDLVRHADKALYKAKNDGRNRTHAFG